MVKSIGHLYPSVTSVLLISRFSSNKTQTYINILIVRFLQAELVCWARVTFTLSSSSCALTGDPMRGVVIMLLHRLWSLVFINRIPCHKIRSFSVTSLILLLLFLPLIFPVIMMFLNASLLGISNLTAWYRRWLISLSEEHVLIQPSMLFSGSDLFNSMSTWEYNEVVFQCLPHPQRGMLPLFLPGQWVFCSAQLFTYNGPYADPDPRAVFVTQLWVASPSLHGAAIVLYLVSDQDGFSYFLQYFHTLDIFIM